MNPLILRMERFHSNDDATIGIVESEKHCLFTCEDEFRSEKVAGETRIPEGVYPIRLRTEGGMIKRYQQIYDNHPGMLWLQNVPGFEYVYIHHGNTDEHTDGCVLVGYGAQLSRELCISNSRSAYRVLYAEILEAIESGREVFIEIVDKDRDWE